MSNLIREALSRAIKALGDLSFECDGVVATRAPSRETYNRTFKVLQESRAALASLDAPVQADRADVQEALEEVAAFKDSLSGYPNPAMTPLEKAALVLASHVRSTARASGSVHLELQKTAHGTIVKINGDIVHGDEEWAKDDSGLDIVSIPVPSAMFPSGRSTARGEGLRDGQDCPDKFCAGLLVREGSAFVCTGAVHHRFAAPAPEQGKETDQEKEGGTK